jgi:dephospho-CoA kinase
MLIVGLTGSIGMGKSTAAEHLRKIGIPVLDADAVVHALYEGAAVPLIEAAFPGTTSQGKVDRQKLSAQLIGQPGEIRRLEAIVHPLVRAEERRFLSQEAARGSPLAVLEVPLLFETSADQLVDAVIALTAPPEVQRARVMQRPGMTQAKLDALLARQMPDDEKRAKADFVVDTSGPVTATRAALDKVVAELKQRTGTAFDRHWR